MLTPNFGYLITNDRFH